MILGVIRAALVVCLAGCAATAPHPYRFSSPLMGAADVPVSWSPAPEPAKPAAAAKPDDTIQVQDGIHLEPKPTLVAQ